MHQRILASVGIVSLLVLGLPTSAFAASETVVDTPAAPIMVDNSQTLIPFGVTASGQVDTATITVDFLSSNDETCTPPADGAQSFPGELSMVLSSPGGREATLVYAFPSPSYVGYPAPLRVQVTFDDAAATAIGGIPATGTFRPATPLSVFQGEPAAGTWQLRFADGSSSDAKCYFGASLSIDAGDPTTTTLNAPATTIAVGLPVTLSAAVAKEVQPDFAAREAMPPTGTVTFMDGVTTLGSAALDGTGTATFPASFTTSGEHFVTAVYSGDSDHLASTSNEQLIEAYDRTVSITTLAASQTFITAGESSTFTATIAPEAITEPTLGAAANGPGLTGTVQFWNGTTLLGEAPVVDGEATATYTFPIASLQPVTAVYSGDAEFAGSTSAVVEVTVAARTVVPIAPIAPPAKAATMTLADTGSSAPASSGILWGLGLAAAGLLTAICARRARRIEAN